jgi:hypothetical protein
MFFAAGWIAIEHSTVRKLAANACARVRAVSRTAVEIV